MAKAYDTFGNRHLRGALPPVKLETGTGLSVEVSLVRNTGDGMETCNDAPHAAQGYGVYIRNPHALHVLDVNGGELDSDGAHISMREAHHRAFQYAGTLAEHLGCDVVTAIAIGADYWWSRFAVVPQRDLLAAPGWSPDRETRFEQCEEADATCWALFRLGATANGRHDSLFGDSDLVEDYPTRAAAEVAAAALDRGQPLPAPEWPAAPPPPAPVTLAFDVWFDVPVRAVIRGVASRDEAEAVARHLAERIEATNECLSGADYLAPLVTEFSIHGLAREDAVDLEAIDE